MVLLAWVVSRAWLIAAPGWSAYPHHLAVTGDVRLYSRWASLLVSGTFPVHDPSWQYPPGAAGLLVLPALGPLRYYPAFVILALLADALVLAVLVALARRTTCRAGLWVWIVGMTALGPMVFNRFDVVPTLLAVIGLAVAERSALAGALFGLGAAVKVWPLLLLPAAAHRVRALAGALGVATVGLGTLASLGRLGPGFDFLHNQRARGLQVETVAATPYLLARAFGAPGLPIVRQYGAYQVHGPGVQALVTLSAVASALVVLGYLVLAVRRPPDPGLALAALLGLLLTSRVLSPQYLIWVLGVTAVVVSSPRSRQRSTAVLLVVVCGLTQWLFPIWYPGLMHRAVGSAVLLTVRNVLLVATFVVAVRAALAVRVEADAPSARQAAPASRVTE